MYKFLAFGKTNSFILLLLTRNFRIFVPCCNCSDMKRKMFCEISPFTYRLSVEKEILKRHLKDALRKTNFAKERTDKSLPVLIYRHNSLIRRRLGNVNMQLQENKATNLALAVKHIDGLLIRPGETFSLDPATGRCLDSQLIRANHAKVMYECPEELIE